MSKLVFLETNDIHWRVANPKARKDDYNMAVKSKLIEVFTIAQEKKAAGILIPGDIVDTPGLALNSIAELASILSFSPCPIYTIAGQHDEWGHNPITLTRTPYGLLSRLGYIKDVSREPAWIELGGKLIRITGRHYDDAVDTENYYEMPSLDGVKIAETITIHLAHGLVLENKLGFEKAKHTPLKELKTSADILCVGDYHFGIGIKKVGSTYVINPGALGRVKAEIEEIDREIQIALIEISEESGITAELIPLKSAQPGSEVLSRDHLVQLAEREDRMNNFLSLLAAEGESKFLEVREIVDDIARREKLPDDVRNEALKRIALARETLGRVS